MTVSGRPPPQAVNSNYLLRAQQTLALPSSIPDGTAISEQLLEYDASLAATRITRFISMPRNTRLTLAAATAGVEMLITAGAVATQQSDFPAGFYLRDPSPGSTQLSTVDGCRLLLKSNQFSVQDDGHRCIDSRDPQRWLPNVDGTCCICPLHGFSGDSTMLIRWLKDGSFKPGLDPQGEEILVLKGQLNDASGSYPAGTWLREPVRQWHHWQGTQDTLIYYKNGHFPAPSAATSAQRPAS